MSTLAQDVTSELDDGDDHNQADYDTEDGSDDGGLVPRLASIEVNVLMMTTGGRHRRSDRPHTLHGCLWVAVETQCFLRSMHFNLRFKV